MASEATVTWEAWKGVDLVPTGKTRRSGKAETIMVVGVLVCMSESDANKMTRLYPRLKFVKRVGRPRATLPEGQGDE